MFPLLQSLDEGERIESEGSRDETGFLARSGHDPVSCLSRPVESPSAQSIPRPFPETTIPIAPPSSGILGPAAGPPVQHSLTVRTGRPGRTDRPRFPPDRSPTGRRRVGEGGRVRAGNDRASRRDGPAADTFGAPRLRDRRPQKPESRSAPGRHDSETPPFRPSVPPLTKPVHGNRIPGSRRRGDNPLILVFVDHGLRVGGMQELHLDSARSCPP